MKARTNPRKWLAYIVAVIAFSGMTASPALAQCATCYATVASSGARVIEALRSGILVLILPTLALFGAILFSVFRRVKSETRGEQPWPTYLPGSDSDHNRGPAIP